jgi:hypothetical protein
MKESRMANKEELELIKQAQLVKRIKRLNKVANEVRRKYPTRLNVIKESHLLLELGE